MSQITNNHDNQCFEYIFFLCSQCNLFVWSSALNHLITLPISLIKQQPRRLGTSNRQLNRAPLVGKMRGQDIQLAQHGGLIPQDMLVVEAVAADVDDADGGDGEGLVGWGDFGEEGGDFGGVGAAEDEFVWTCLMFCLPFFGVDETYRRCGLGRWCGRRF